MLAFADLTATRLAKANLEFAMLTDAVLVNANLSAADLTCCFLQNANLTSVRAAGANFSEARLHEAKLIRADLTGANLRKCEFNRADLTHARLDRAGITDADFAASTLRNASLQRAIGRFVDFTEADLRGANLSRSEISHSIFLMARMNGARCNRADLSESNFLEANLTSAALRGSDLRDADWNAAKLCSADLTGATLERSVLVDTNFQNSVIANCRIYGASAWSVNLDGAVQSNLIITKDEEPTIQVDGLEVGQFVYLLLNNRKIRDVIDTIGKKAVLILGRFLTERKKILEDIRQTLRDCGYLPIVFDFEKPATRDTQETIVTLASLSRFVIADITDPRSVPQELVIIVHSLPSVPVQPLLERGSGPWGMFDHIQQYPSVLPPHIYDTSAALVSDLRGSLIAVAELKAAHPKLKGNA